MFTIKEAIYNYIMNIDPDYLRTAGIVFGGVIATIAPYIGSWIGKKFSKHDEATIFIDNTKHRITINEVLVEIRALVGANRVAIVEYHNGNTAINGLPFNYSSMTYEKADNTTREMMLNYQRVPISPTCELLMDVHTSDEGYIRTGKDYFRESVVELNKYYGIDTNYIFRIGDHIKYGTVHVMWVNEDIVLTKEEIETIHLKVLYVNEVMSKMKKHS